MRTSPAVPATRGFSHSLQERSDSPQRERAYVHFQPIHARSFPRQLCGRRVRQALALGSRVAIGTGSRLRLVPGADTNITLGLSARRQPTAHRFAACAPGRQDLPAGLFGTAFRDCLGFRIKIAALPAAEIHSRVMRITQIRLLGQGRVGPILSRRAPAPLSCSYGSTHPLGRWSPHLS